MFHRIGSSAMAVAASFACLECRVRCTYEIPSFHFERKARGISKNWEQIGNKTRCVTADSWVSTPTKAVESSRLWRKRVRVELTTRLAKSRIAGFEGREGHRTPFASAMILQDLVHRRKRLRLRNWLWCYCGAIRNPGTFSWTLDHRENWQLTGVYSRPRRHAAALF